MRGSRDSCCRFRPYTEYLRPVTVSTWYYKDQSTSMYAAMLDDAKALAGLDVVLRNSTVNWQIGWQVLMDLEATGSWRGRGPPLA